MRCHRCGHSNPEGSRFCVECGAALASDKVTSAMSVIGEEPALPPHVLTPWAEQTHADAVTALPPGTALLVVQRGPTPGNRFLLDQPVLTVGRHPDNDILLDDVTVSRRHAEFYRRDGGFGVRDVGSLNGTYVNRQPVHEAPLASGDQVQIGKFSLLFLTELPPRDSAGRADGGQDVQDRSPRRTAPR